tara:strand:- start:71 stop:586 length:516 start_codon:yes stop_codon:yes gene_type:complete
MKIFLLINIFSIVASFVYRGPEKIKSRVPVYSTNNIDWGSDEYDDDIQLLEHEDATLALKSWEGLSKWKNEEIQKYLIIANAKNPDDIFIGYTPLHNSIRKLVYIFHSKLSVKDTGPYLTILSGICCPHDGTFFESKEFKETLERQLTIVPIDFTPLANDPRFGLSWSLDD